MKLHTPLAVAFLLFSFSASQARAQSSSAPSPGQQTQNQPAAPDPKPAGAKDANLDRLIELIGAPQASAQLARQLLDIRKQFAPRTLALTNWRHETFQAALEAKIRSRVTASAIAERWAPILACHFSSEEIKAIVQFYETPAGRKFLAEQPAILRESFLATEEWRTETVARILKELKEEFPGARETEQALQVNAHKP